VQPALDMVTDWEETHDGVTTSQPSWQLGYGPRTSACWLIRPADTDGPLPGVLALHCHGGNKFGGADRLVELPAEHPSAALARADLYEGRAIATDLARRGFAVLAHNSFAWGSRRFDLAAPPRRTADALQAAEKYAGEFWPGKHIFTAAMQAQATGFLQEILAAPPEKNPSD
jgi:hypothetical protein